jgi:hypothetical protein
VASALCVTSPWGYVFDERAAGDITLQYLARTWFVVVGHSYEKKKKVIALFSMMANRDAAPAVPNGPQIGNSP